jgi:hypothetical protein
MGRNIEIAYVADVIPQQSLTIANNTTQNLSITSSQSSTSIPTKNLPLLLQTRPHRISHRIQSPRQQRLMFHLGPVIPHLQPTAPVTQLNVALVEAHPVILCLFLTKHNIPISYWFLAGMG